MAKKIITPHNPTHLRPSRLVFDLSVKTKYFILAVVGFVFYANSILNKYVFDDNMTIVKNSYVKIGLAGIPKILTNDALASYYTNSGASPAEQQLSGGRYRPLSEIVFAIEQQLFGNSVILPYFRHLINVLAYVACIIAVFYFLEKFILKKVTWGSDISFVAALLFAIHPIHTEVVANIKSLDEILSLLFIMLTFINGLRYLQGKHTKHLIYGVGSFLFALLSKEYAVTLLFFIPFLFYLQEGKKPLSAIQSGIPYYVIFVAYLLLRYNAVGFHSNIQTSIVNNPYIFATYTQKVATEWFVLVKYLGLLLFPYPLACDYSYYQITYHNFSDITVLLSIVIYAGIFAMGIILMRKKNVLSFAVFFFLLTIFMVSNFAIDIGATMGERLVFHSSLGLVIILSYYLFALISEVPVQTKRKIVIGSLSVMGVVCFGETIVRNAQWKDETTLFIHDVKIVPNSCLVNANAGWAYLGYAQREKSETEAKSYLDSAHKYLLRALYFNSRYEAAYLDLGVVYLHLEQPDSAQYCWDKVKALLPNQPMLDSNYAMLSQYYFEKGIEFGKDGNLSKCISFIRKAILNDSTNANKWYNLGIAYFRAQEYDSARYTFIKTLESKPNATDEANAKSGLQALEEMKVK